LHFDFHDRSGNFGDFRRIVKNVKLQKLAISSRRRFDSRPQKFFNLFARQFFIGKFSARKKTLRQFVKFVEIYFSKKSRKFYREYFFVEISHRRNFPVFFASIFSISGLMKKMEAEHVVLSWIHRLQVGGG